jgi:hypothetical protein
MASQQEFADWQRHPVTQQVIRYLEGKKDTLLERLVNLECDTVEQFGIHHLALRNQVNGLGEFLDLDNLKEVIGNDDPN